MGSVVFLPTSKTISYWWNLGSLLGLFFGVQLVSGVLLVFYYSTDFGFDSVQYIMYDVNWGWLMRLIHFNGASFFFFFMYLHLFKGLFMMSYRLYFVWFVGVFMIFLFMAVGFMGYVLVYSQMSFWAAVVITSLLTIFPFIGEYLVYFIWGGFSVIGLTVKFFFVFHFLLPWAGVGLVMLHLLFLHYSGSSSILYCHGDYDKIAFFPYFWFKDVLGFVMLVVMVGFIFSFPFILGESEMFVEHNPLASPIHIAPEWYFLFAYAILRAIPNKVVGVVGMMVSIFMLLTLIFCKNVIGGKVVKFLGFVLLFSCVMLTWLGVNAPEVPYLFLGQCFTFFFFFFFFLMFFYSCCVGFLFVS
nr:cytochrome b [Aspiculuris sp. PC-2022]